MFQSLTLLRELSVLYGDLDPRAIPPTVRVLTMDDSSVEPMTMLSAVEDRSWLPGLRKLTFACIHPGEDEEDDDGNALDMFDDAEREEHDFCMCEIEDAARARRIKIEVW